MRHRLLLTSTALVVVSLLSALVGCDGPTTCDVSGSIASGGKPVAEARIAFYDRSGAIARMATVDSSGAYRVDEGLAPGTYAVAVFPIEAPMAAPMPPTKSLSSEASSPLGEPFPEKYFAPGTSGLTREVTAEGENRFDFALD